METGTVRAIECRGFGAWPAVETVPCRGWLMRTSGGRSRRANACQPLAPEGPFAAVLDEAERFYAARGRPTVVRITPLASPDAEPCLVSGGYRPIEESLVMVREAVASFGTADGIVLTDLADPRWHAGSEAAHGLSAEEAEARRDIIARIRPPAVAATALGEGPDPAPQAYGLAVADEGWTGLFAIITVSAARRQGAGRRLVAGLLAWGAGQGAPAAYLQVGAANAPAIALYRRLGFAEAYRYRYYVKP